MFERTDEEASVELPGDRSTRSDEDAVEPAPDPAADAAAASTDSVVDLARLDAALDRLVRRGVLDVAQAGAVIQEYGGHGEPPRPTGLRRQLGEIAGYLGASFVLGATLLFLSEEWESLGRSGRVAILTVMAAVLLGAGVAVRWRAAAPGVRWWRPWTGDSVRRRLSSTLLTAGAITTGTAVYAGFDTSTEPFTPPAYAPLVASAAGLAVVIVGYLLARSAFGQLAAAVGAYLTLGNLLAVLGADDIAVLGAAALVLGATWVWLVWRGSVAERRFALAIAVTFGLVGAQMIVVGDTGNQNILGYALTAVVAGVCFAAYARIREWVALAGGVIGATLVVPEFLYDVTGGSLGASGVMLVAGVTLLAGSLIGLRIRNTADVDPLPTAP